MFASNAVDSIFVESNRLYGVNDFEQAIKGYLSITDKNIDNKVLYYNIGNCYYKLSKLGYARLYYEKAKLYNPRDKDISHNIEVVKTKLIDDVKVIPKFFIVRIVNNINILFSPSQWAFIVLFVLYVCLFFFILFLFSQSVELKMNSLRTLFFIVPLFIIVLFFLFYSNMNHNNDDAILISSNTYVKTAPSPSSDDYFIIHEGVKFKIVDQVENWSRVLLSDGKDGWVENKHFLKVKK